ncbi:MULTISPECIES: 2-hydroxychromene-2-carboxylate isomerase [Marinobacter]|uniref:2-hydroxychromene-2-carboxylate isomerase n=1 Tax=Marinobacter metalliresistant TaxID=2961995 RepID=A0ABZ2VXT5_9GAMM|nr:2-hydroxychromene-2-carboxylate isomerase [Marinobacter sp. Arc7-DN-1]AXS83788.1 2-hydroxychromene-2-carboxylate isomerase [Marinobacter sp. Arc7-DN-1]
MSPRIDYYFTSISPFTYLGHQAFLETAGQAGAEVNFKPVKLAEVFANSGAKPVPERPACRQAYRLLEIERWARKRGLAVNLKPAHFPTDPGLADRCVIALQQAGHNPGEFVQRVLAACWAEEKNIADEAVIRDILNALELDADGLIQAAQSTNITDQYDRNSEDAVRQGVLGAPAYVLNGEQFWGQDRVELLAETLELMPGAE